MTALGSVGPVVKEANVGLCFVRNSSVWGPRQACVNPHLSERQGSGLGQTAGGPAKQPAPTDVRLQEGQVLGFPGSCRV